MDTSTNITPKFWDSLPEAFRLRAPGSSYVTSTELAKQIRADLKAAVAAGVFPKGTEFSVRVNRGGHHRSLTLEFKTWGGGAVFSDSYVEAHLEAFAEQRLPRLGYDRVSIYSSAFAAARRDAERIAERHNFDNSDLQTDYFDRGYYLSLTTSDVETSAIVGMRCEADPAFAAKRQRAIEAASKLPKNFVKAIADEGIENAGEYTIDQILRWYDNAQGRQIVHSPRHGWHYAEAAETAAA